MFGMRHQASDEGRCCAGRSRRGRFFGGPGWGGRHGMGGGNMMRAGRMLAQGDLQLIALALIAEQPRHGYEIIKVLEEKTSGWYSPSPGIVYPTLTYLEEVGYVTAQTEGAKRLYTITEEGRAHLEANRDLADTVLDRLATIGERVARWRRMSGRDSDDRRAVPPLVEAALSNLREAAVTRLEGDGDAESRVVEILARAATELKRQ
jgi:DNA-binding PadR family transcriptional regulator